MIRRLLPPLLFPLTAFAQGPLTPPSGVPQEGMKSLQEIWDKIGVLQTQLNTTQSDIIRLKSDNQLLTGLLSSSSSSLSLPWNMVTLDSADSVGTFLSMAVSPVGLPAVAYYKITGTDLKFSMFNGTTWETTVVDYAGGVETSIAFGADGQPSITYWNISAGIGSALKFATRNNGGWLISTVETGSVGKNSSLAFDPLGKPAIAYYDSTNTNLKFARYNGATWTITTVDNSANDVGGSSSGGKNSLAFGPDGQPVIAYQDNTAADLKFARYNGSTWTLSTLDSTGNVGSDASLKFGPDGQPAIAYRDNTNSDVKLARYSGAAWVLSTVESTGNVGISSSLAFGPEGQPAIAYYDSTNADLRFSRYNGSTWASSAVDTAGAVGSFCALSFGQDGQPMIAYYDNTNEDLKFARKGIFKPAP